MINGGAGTDTLTIFTEAANTINLARATISGVENLVIDARDGEINEVEANSIDFSAVTFEGNDFEFGALVLNNIAANAAVTIQDVEMMSGEDSISINLTQENTDINGSLTLTNVLDADDIDIVVGSDSAEADVYTLTLDNVNGIGEDASIEINGIETWNINVEGDSDIYALDHDGVGDAARDVTVNLTLNADLTVQWFDLAGGSDAEATLNITGAGSLTAGEDSSIESDGAAFTIAAGGATGNLSLYNIDSDAAAVTTGSGDDLIEIENSATVVVAGAGDDMLQVNEGLSLVADTSDAFDADIDGGEGFDTIEMDQDDIMNSADLLAAIATNGGAEEDFTTAIRNFERLAVMDVHGHGSDDVVIDATLFGINNVLLGGNSISASDDVSLVVADEAQIEIESFGGSDGTLVIDVAGASDADDNTVSLTLSGVVGSDSEFYQIDLADVETLSLVSTGAESDDAVLDGDDDGFNGLVIDASETVTLNITGDAQLWISDDSFFTDLETVNAGEFDAGLTIDLSAVAQGVAITVGDGDDTIVGTAYNDTIVAGAGENTITGGLGKDTITTGDDVDTFFFNVVADSQGTTVDVINNFQVEEVVGQDTNGDDIIVSDVLDFSALATGWGGSGEPTLEGYLGEAEGYGAVLTSLISGKVTAVLDSTTSILYIDVNGSATLDNQDMAIKLTGVTELDAIANFNWVAVM